MGVISNRVKAIEESGIRKIFNLTRGKDFIDFSIGQPDFEPPEYLIEEAFKNIKAGYNKYTVTQGLPEVREYISEELKTKYGRKPEEVILTCGVAGALTLLFLTLLDPGDEVIIPDPYFVIYPNLARMCGAKPVFVDTYPDFKLTGEKIISLCSSHTKLIVLNSPANPTGKILDYNSIKEIVEIASKQNIWIVSDEIYDTFIYDKEKIDSPFSMYEKVIIVNGYSKSLGIPGWRLGYAAGPKEIIDNMAKLQQFTFVCAPSFAQRIIPSIKKEFLQYIRREYRKKRDIAYDLLKDTFEVVKPEGAFYLFPKSPIKDTQKFVKECIEKGVLIVPGKVFSKRNTHFRLSFATDIEKLKKGITLLKELGEELKKEND